MVQIREIAPGEQPPADADYVIIEVTKAGRFTANGSVAHPDGASFFTPPPFASLELAISISKVWAEANNVRAIYVRAE